MLIILEISNERHYSLLRKKKREKSVCGYAAVCFNEAAFNFFDPVNSITWSVRAMWGWISFSTHLSACTGYNKRNRKNPPNRAVTSRWVAATYRVLLFFFRFNRLVLRNGSLHTHQKEASHEVTHVVITVNSGIAYHIVSLGFCSLTECWVGCVHWTC